MHLVLGVNRGAVPCYRTTVNHWCSQQYEKHWNEGDTTSTNNEKVRALAEEIIVSTEHSLPIWNGVVTKAWCKMLDLGGVQPAKSRKLAVDIRQRLATGVQGIRVEDTNKHKTWGGGTPRQER